MARKYKWSFGSKNYANFRQENLEIALSDMSKDVSQAESSWRNNNARCKLRNKLFGKPRRSLGHLTTLSSEYEQSVIRALTQVANLGFPLTSHDVAQLVAKYV